MAAQYLAKLAAGKQEPHTGKRADCYTSGRPLLSIGQPQIALASGVGVGVGGSSQTLKQQRKSYILIFGFRDVDV